MTLMTRSYSNVLVHVVFSTRERLPLIELGGFAWQDGYSVFSTRPDGVKTLRRYIKNLWD